MAEFIGVSHELGTNVLNAFFKTPTGVKKVIVTWQGGYSIPPTWFEMAAKEALVTRNPVTALFG